MTWAQVNNYIGHINAAGDEIEQDRAEQKATETVKERLAKARGVGLN